jgi:hypothetical protein
VYIFDGVLYAVLWALAIGLSVRHYRNTNGGEDFKLAVLHGVTPSHPDKFTNRTLLGYRFVVFCVFLGIHLAEVGAFLCRMVVCAV